MNRKILKISFILILAFTFCISYVYATSDINLNLPGITNEPVPSNNQTTNNTETSDQNNLDNIEDPSTNVPDTPTTTPTENLQPSGISTSSQTELGVTNIINILLITVGVILILLGIAILIRLRG